MLEYSPEEVKQAQKNSDDVIKIIVDNRALIREFSEDDYIFLGIFLVQILSVENAIDEAISIGFPKCRDQMLGRKIDLLIIILKELKSLDIDTGDWYKLISPLRELAKVRGKFAHNIKKKKFEHGELKQIEAYIKNRRPNWYSPTEETNKGARWNDLCHIASFSWLVQERLAFLQYALRKTRQE